MEKRRGQVGKEGGKKKDKKEAELIPYLLQQLATVLSTLLDDVLADGLVQLLGRRRGQMSEMALLQLLAGIEQQLAATQIGQRWQLCSSCARLRGCRGGCAIDAQRDADGSLAAGNAAR